jgi:hypothetical protein
VPVLVVPVAASGRHVGRIELGARQNGRPYSDREVALMLAAGQSLAAVALDLADMPSHMEASAPAPSALAADPSD